MSWISQHIRFCSALDGIHIAAAVGGKGPPLVRASHWLSHVEFDLRSPVSIPWLRELSRDHTYIRYDHRGCGLSDWTVPSFAFETWVDNLEAVVDMLRLRRFALFGVVTRRCDRYCLLGAASRTGLPSRSLGAYSRVGCGGNQRRNRRTKRRRCSNSFVWVGDATMRRFDNSSCRRSYRQHAGAAGACRPPGYLKAAGLPKRNSKFCDWLLRVSITAPSPRQ